MNRPNENPKLQKMQETICHFCLMELCITVILTHTHTQGISMRVVFDEKAGVYSDQQAKLMKVAKAGSALQV